MPILIKSMKMPETCEDCNLESFCDLWVEARRLCNNKRSTIRHPDCPLISVPDEYEYSEAGYKDRKAAGSPKWISVKNRLPDNDDFVIVTIRDESGDTPYVYINFGWYFDRAKCWIIDTEQRDDVTHWMPLPEPIKEEE